MTAISLILAALTIAGAVAAMSLRNPVHCVLCLVVAFAGLAGMYLGLGAQFLGLAQVLVYIGAVAILVVFVLLLTRGGERGGEPRGNRGWKSGLAVAALVGAVLAAAVLAGPVPSPRGEAPKLPSVRDTGDALMSEFVLPLQVVGVMLTAAMIGAAVLALRERPVDSSARPPADSRS